MDIATIRNASGLSQRAFANYFGIPIGTLRNWEQNIASPPPYVAEMIIQSIRRDKMINVETIEFIKLCDSLAELSKNGIEPFANATADNVHTKIFYDERNADDEGHYKVVLDACIVEDPKCIHHDIVSYYDSDSLEYTIRIVFQKDEEGLTPSVLICFKTSEKQIVIEDGIWYFI